jgi:hypothetical protein
LLEANRTTDCTYPERSDGAVKNALNGRGVVAQGHEFRSGDRCKNEPSIPLPWTACKCYESALDLPSFLRPPFGGRPVWRPAWLGQDGLWIERRWPSDLLRPPGSEPDFPCSLCDDPHCREWPDLWPCDANGRPAGGLMMF